MMLLNVCLAFGVVGFTTAVSCPPDMTENDGHCYAAVTTKKNFDDANAFCKTTYAGATLTSVASDSENAFVRGLATGDIWIGGRATVTDVMGSYYWLSYYGSTTCGPDFSYTNWKSDEPNNTHLPTEGPEDCIEMYPTGVWNDQTCTDSLPFVCKV